MSPDLTPILDDLAAGRIDAAEAARRIDAAKASAQKPESPPKPEPPIDAEIVEDPGEPEVSSEAEVPSEEQVPAGRVGVRAMGRRVRVLGDASVPAVTAQGPHTLRRVGDRWEVEAEGDFAGFRGLPDLASLSGLRAPRSVDDLVKLGLGQEVVVRVNPALPLDLESTAGGVVVDGLPLLGRLRVTAGTASLRGVRRIQDALVQAATVTLQGRFDRGRSRVRCESGAITVALAPDADVTVAGEAQVGRLTWPGGETGLSEYVAGEGAGRLDLDVVVGMVTVTQEPS